LNTSNSSHANICVTLENEDISFFAVMVSCVTALGRFWESNVRISCCIRWYRPILSNTRKMFMAVYRVAQK